MFFETILKTLFAEYFKRILKENNKIMHVFSISFRMPAEIQNNVCYLFVLFCFLFYVIKLFKFFLSKNWYLN